MPPEPIQHQLTHYTDASGTGLFGEWLWEQRTHYGAGYRVFYTVEGGRVILLLAGSDKSGQSATIKAA